MAPPRIRRSLHHDRCQRFLVLLVLGGLILPTKGAVWNLSRGVAHASRQLGKRYSNNSSESPSPSVETPSPVPSCPPGMIFLVNQAGSPDCTHASSSNDTVPSLLRELEKLLKQRGNGSQTGPTTIAPTPLPETPLHTEFQETLLQLDEAKSRERRDHAPFLFDAYDCSYPVDIEDVGHSLTTHCITDDKIGPIKQNVSYQLLQKERIRVAKGYTCQVTKTQTNRYCGVYDHQTTQSADEVFHLPFFVSTSICKEMHRTKKFIDPKGDSHELVEGGINTIQYFLKGQSYNDGGEIKCLGEDYVFRGRIQHQTVVSIHLQITMLQEEYMFSKEEIIAQTTKTKLPCLPIEGECHTLTTTYLWTIKGISEDCDLSITRTMSGLETSNHGGDTIFMSTDDSLVRVLRKHTEPRCGRVVYTTNYPELFLYRTDGPNPFTKKVEPQTISTITFVKNRDDYLLNSLSDLVEQEFNNVIRYDCNRQNEQAKLSFWMQHKDPGVTTWMVGKNLFATASGEVIYQYKCAPVQVRAKEVEGCFQAMPVQLGSAVRKIEELRQEGVTAERKRKISLGLSPESALPSHLEPPINYGLDLYMEPLTRRLTHIGIPTPCARAFAPKYKNINGGWISSSGQTQITTAPRLPSDLEERKSALRQDNRPNMAEGGIYDKASQDALEEYQDFGRAQLGFTGTLTRQASHSTSYRLGQPIHARDIFGNFPDPNPFSGIWAAIIKFLQDFGEISSVLIALYILATITLKIIEWGYNLFILRDIHGCGRMLCWIPCMSLFLVKAYKHSEFAHKERIKRHNARLDKAQKRGYSHVQPHDYIIVENPEPLQDPLVKNNPDMGSHVPLGEAPTYAISDPLERAEFSSFGSPTDAKISKGYLRSMTEEELTVAFKGIIKATRSDDSLPEYPGVPLPPPPPPPPPVLPPRVTPLSKLRCPEWMDAMRRADSQAAKTGSSPVPTGWPRGVVPDPHVAGDHIPIRTAMLRSPPRTYPDLKPGLPSDI